MSAPTIDTIDPINDDPEEILADASAAFTLAMQVEGDGWLVQGLDGKGSWHVLYDLDGSTLLNEVEAEWEKDYLLKRTLERVV